jgi:hypothetical protein
MSMTSQRRWCRNGVLAMLCLVSAGMVADVETDVIVVSIFD